MRCAAFPGVDGLRLIALAGSIGTVMVGTLYGAAVDDELADAPMLLALAPLATEADEPSVGGLAYETPIEAGPAPVEPTEPAPETGPGNAAETGTADALPEGAEVPEELAALLDAEQGSILDVETGVRVGPLKIVEDVAPLEAVEPLEVAPEPRPSRARAARRAPPPAPVPRLHPNPGMHVILTARRMIARNERIQGSCYRYISEVFARAGHEGWRNRRTVYNGRRNGPYANLDLIRPGDWLYIVNHPDRTPVGTHSVLFVGWEDRARGYARVIEHRGWGAPSAGSERGYDVSRTYRITRPVLRR